MTAAKEKNSKRSVMKKGIPATTAVLSTSVLSKTGSSKESILTFRALNDFYIIEEDPIELQTDNGGLTKDVVAALKESRLVLPEIAEGYADKYPFTGTIVSKGPDTENHDLKLGVRVMFPRLGGMRWQKEGKQMINIKETDIHAILS